MRKFILNIMAFVFFSVLFAVAAIFLPPRLWDAAVIFFSVLIFLNKKTAFIAGLTLVAGLYLEMLSNIDPGIQMAALFASLFSAYLLKNQLLKLNRWAAFILNIAGATAVYRLSLIILSALSGNLISDFTQTVYDLSDIRIFPIVVLCNIILSLLFLWAHNAAKKRLFERFFIFR
ncbi:hypothetical protein EPN15_04120 [Patescibacteria group bacterium]|nr:MAG: hypothetical protein EPN15_04120 [Patescibacteria group bacterium]